MPNRMIRDGILESEAVLSLPVEARWLYVTILLSADDVGLFEATPFRLARRADVKREHADKLLQMIADADLVRLYEADGKRFGFIPRFNQRLQIKRIKHAAPPDSLIQDEPETLNKIKHLSSKTTVVHGFASDAQRNSTAAQPPEPEPEVEEEFFPKGKSVARPEPKAAAKPRPARKAPESFLVDSSLQQWAREKVPGVDIRAETEKFRDHTFARSISDWPGAWRNWMRKAAQDLQRRPGVAGGESFRERDARLAAERVKAFTGGLCHDRKALGEEPRQPMPFERGYVAPADIIEGEAHEQRRITG